MTAHARDIEPDFGSLDDVDDDEERERPADRPTRREPRLRADEREPSGFVLHADDRIGGETAAFAPAPPRPETIEAPADYGLAVVWGGFWRAVVIGVVAGAVGGVVGAFTLVWLTGAGWTVFAKMLIEAISHM